MPASKKKPAASPPPSTCPHPLGTLISIGGHERKTVSDDDTVGDMADDAILRRVVDEVGSKGPILVLPIASEEQEEAGEEYRKVFRHLGCSEVNVLRIYSREEAESEQALQLLNEAGGVMFTGGDQLRITALLGGTRFQRRLKERYTHEPFVIAGTSAGATAMSTPMIYQGRNNAGMLKDEIHITTGLEFLHNVAIDTHFVVRGRIVRMAQIIATNPACIGLGLEEDTAVVVTQGRELEVIGSGLVVVLDGMGVTETNIHEVEPGTPFSIRNLRMHLLSSGQRYTLPIIEQMHA